MPPYKKVLFGDTRRQFLNIRLILSLKNTLPLVSQFTNECLPVSRTHQFLLEWDVITLFYYLLAYHNCHCKIEGTFFEENSLNSQFRVKRERNEKLYY